MKTGWRISRAALGALILGFCGAPSCSTLPPGETMLILQTDLALPKDIDKVDIRVLVNGTAVFKQSFEKLGMAQESLKIPASLGVTIGKGTDPTTPVTFRVTAWQGNVPRVIRESITTIPTNRLVSLKMPIQWLCWDQVAPDGVDEDLQPQAKTTCPTDQTCVAGTCTTKTVDPATLDDYAPEKVFGGGVKGDGSDGKCFDVNACFASSVDIPVDLAQCTIAVNGDANVAIRVDSAGICGSSGCFVPIDAKSEFGWSSSAAGTIKLPQGVCDKLKAGTAAGVSTVGVTTDCPLKTDALPTCGPWSSAGKAPPDPAAVGPVTLIGNQLQPVSIAVGGGSVYWTVAGSYTQPQGAVKRIPIDGGSAGAVQVNLAYARDLALTTDPVTGTLRNLAWTAAGISKMGATVTAKDFSDPSMVTDLFAAPTVTQPEGVAILGKTVFFTDGGDKAVYRVDASGVTALAGSTLNAPQNNPYRIVADKDNVFWTNEGGATTHDGSIQLCNLTDPVPIAIAPNQDLPRNLAVDIDATTSLATAVYWANYGANGTPVSEQVMMASLADPQSIVPVAVAPGHQPYGIAVDKDAVYWTNHGDNTVMKMLKADSSVHLLAKGQNAPGALALDATHIYWVNEGSATSPGSIVRLAKAAPDAAP